MKSLENLQKLWARAKPILLSADGGALQGYVFDVPRRELERTINHFCQRAHPAVMDTLNGFTFPEGQAPECTVVTRTDILSATQHSIVSGQFYRDRHLQFWIFPNSKGDMFDAEFVFFANEFFDENDADTKKRDVFGVIYNLAEAVRQNQPECECALSGSEVGDPREERNEDWTVFW